jgi:hypothetical protein
MRVDYMAAFPSGVKAMLGLEKAVHGSAGSSRSCSSW